MLEREASRTRSRFAPWTTAVYAALWVAVVAHGWGGLIDGDATVWLRQPARTAARMTARDLELAEAVGQTSGLEHALLSRLHGSRDDALLHAIEIHTELQGAAPFDTPALRARLAVLLREAGRESEIGERRGPSLPPSQQAEEADALAETLAEPTYRDLAARQVARAAGDLPRVATLAREIRARGAQQKRRSLALQTASLGLIVLGAGAVARLFRRGRRGHLQAAASPWSLEDGIGVFIRGDFFNRAYFVALIWISGLPFGAEFASSMPGELLHTWGTLFASLPLLWLVRHHLLSPDPPRQPSPFGLMPGASRLAGVATICVAAIALDLVGTQAISWSAWGLGVGASWAEGFDEALVFGARSHSVLTTIDYVAWAPAFEELAFRGVLYFSLRQRLGPGSAALASAGVFALLHFYSLPGFLMTLWSGCVWALAFEKTRSLLPGVVAHAVYNGLYVAGLVLLYR